MTVCQWFEHWLTNIASRRLRPRTLETYRTSVRLHIEPVLGPVGLNQLEPDHLEGLYRGLAARGLAPATILRAHRILSRALKVAVQRGKVSRNVATFVDPPAVRATRSASPLAAAEVKAVLRAARGTRNSARWTVALALGLRQSEVLGLGWADLDLEIGTLTISRGLHRVTGAGLVFEQPKTERSRRTVVVPGLLVAELEQHRRDQERERVAADGAWQPSGLVFTRPDGRPIDRRADYQQWRALLDRAGVRAVRLHDARHTAATVLLTEGVHPRVVMELLGHSQMRTTTDIYSHVMPALAREAADRMSAAVLTPHAE
jgi:integrase